MLTDSLTERLVLRDLHAKTAAADNLLFRRRGFLKRKAAFPVQFPYRSLKDDRKIFADEGRVRQSQIERGLYAQHI